MYESTTQNAAIWHRSRTRMNLGPECDKGTMDDAAAAATARTGTKQQLATWRTAISVEWRPAWKLERRPAWILEWRPTTLETVLMGRGGTGG